MSDDVVSDPRIDDVSGTSTAKWTPWVPEPLQDAAPLIQDDSTLSAEDVSARLKNSLARLRERAQKEAYDEGFAKGHAEGLAQGREDGRKQGYNDGHREGYAAGHDAGHEHAEKAAEQLAQLASACATSLDHIESNVGQELINLAIRIAEQVVHRTVKTEPDALLAIIDDILRLDAGKSPIVQLYVHPDDLAMISQYLDRKRTRLNSS